MKTIKLIAMSLIGILLFANNATAQTNQFPTTRTIQGNGFTYQADVVGGIVVLYNRTNQFSGRPGSQRLRDGSPIPREFWFSGQSTVANNPDTVKNQITTIVRNALSAAERQRVGNNRLDVTLRINPDTGIISEVEFRFDTDSPFTTIPVQVYRNIEVNLKNQLRFTPTAKGRRLNFILFGMIDLRLQ